jgi:hypothetical protein
MIVAVFFPSLMGVGIIVSGALLVSDWMRRLLPQGQIRRQHDVVVGAYGAVADTIGAAGYRLAEPWFLRRGPRRRSTYVVLAVWSVLVGAGSIWVGLAFFNDPRGLFYHSPWATGIGYGVGSVALCFGALCLTVAIWHSNLPLPLRRLIEETSLGRYVLPSRSDNAAALSSIEKRS